MVVSSGGNVALPVAEWRLVPRWPRQGELTSGVSQWAVMCDGMTVVTWCREQIKTRQLYATRSFGWRGVALDDQQLAVVHGGKDAPLPLNLLLARAKARTLGWRAIFVVPRPMIGPEDPQQFEVRRRQLVMRTPRHFLDGRVEVIWRRCAGCGAPGPQRQLCNEMFPLRGLCCGAAGTAVRCGSDQSGMPGRETND